MRLDRLHLRNVRCFPSADFDFTDGHNLIVGPNGAGKSTLLESVSLITRGRSFRTSDDRDLVRAGESGYTVRIRVRTAGVSHTWETSRLRDRRSWTADGRPARFLDIFPFAPCVALSSGDSGLVLGPATERRRFLDETLGRTDPSYRRYLLAYHRLLRHRNALLKKKPPNSSRPSTSRWSASSTSLWLRGAASSPISDICSPRPRTPCAGMRSRSSTPRRWKALRNAS